MDGLTQKEKLDLLQAKLDALPGIVLRDLCKAFALGLICGLGIACMVWLIHG